VSLAVKRRALFQVIEGDPPTDKLANCMAQSHATNSVPGVRTATKSL